MSTVGECRNHYKDKQELRNLKFIKRLAIALIICIFALPQYFGIPLPAFALTAQRIALLILLFKLLSRADYFRGLIYDSRGGFLFICVPFLLVAGVTALVRVDISSVFNFLFDALVPMLLLAYCAHRLFEPKEIVHILVVIVTVVCLTAYVDRFILKFNPYELLHTIDSIDGGSAFRAGAYRTAAMCSHPIAFGMYLVLMLPVVCFDVEKREINLCAHPVTLLLMCGSLFLCGSRMPQATFIAGLFFIFLLTPSETKRVLVPYLIVLVLVGVVLIVILRDIPVVRNVVILNIYQMVDSVFGTKFVLDEFGYWQWKYIQSWDYRNLLPKLFFSDDYNPLLGLGAKAANISNFSALIDGRWVASIDNFYVMQYLQYAWPGLISIVLVFVYYLRMFYKGFQTKVKGWSGISILFLISLALYLVNLWFVADLGTFKYLFSLVGLYVGFGMRLRDEGSFAQ